LLKIVLEVGASPAVFSLSIAHWPIERMFFLQDRIDFRDIFLLLWKRSNPSHIFVYHTCL
jgi:hypothetical protein